MGLSEGRVEEEPTPEIDSELNCDLRPKLCCGLFWRTQCGEKLARVLGYCATFSICLAVVLSWAALNAFLTRIKVLGYLWADENFAWYEIGMNHVTIQCLFGVVVALVVKLSFKCVTIVQEVRQEMQQLQATLPAQDV